MSLLSERSKAAVQALLGVSVYQPDPQGVGLDEASQARLREAQGGAIMPMPTTQSEWFMGDLPACQSMADGGNLQKVGRLCRSMKRDGVISGLLKTRTSGLVALPKRWRGDQGIIDELVADAGSRSVFDELCPPAALAALASDGITAGIGIGELVPIKGRKYPRLARLDPEYLQFRWNEGRWYFNSSAGSLPIRPGDGRWVLHTPGGEWAPWNFGSWPALGRAFITKEHAMLHRANFGGKLANPARVAFAPQAATETQRTGFLSRLLQWGVNTCIELLPGWDVKLLESNGRGWEVFGTDIETANLESMIIISGQVVTVTGGTGFANADVHKSIRADLIKETGDTLAHTINTQVLPQYTLALHGVDALADGPRVEWDTTPPEDRQAEAQALTQVAAAITALLSALSEARAANDNDKAIKIALDVLALAKRFGVPLKDAA